MTLLGNRVFADEIKVQVEPTLEQGGSSSHTAGILLGRGGKRHTKDDAGGGGQPGEDRVTWGRSPMGTQPSKDIVTQEQSPGGHS